MSFVPSFGEVLKDPADVRTVSFDWTERLPANATIASSAWTADAGPTLSGDTKSGLVTSVTVSGGEDCRAYRLSNAVTLGDGQVLNRSAILVVKAL